MMVKDINFKNINVTMLCVFIIMCACMVDHSIRMGVDTLRITQQQVLQLGATVLFAIIILRNVYLSLFMIWSIFLYAYHGFSPYSGQYVVNIFFGLLIYHVVNTIANKENAHKIISAIIWLCIANAFYVAVQVSGNEFIYVHHRETTGVMIDPVGFMGLKACMGMLFAFSIPLMAKRNWVISSLFFVPIWLSQCSVALVGGIAGLLFVLWHHSKRIFTAVLLISCLCGAFYVSNDYKSGMFENRFSLWKASLADAVKHPVVGWGLDSFRHWDDKHKNFMYLKNDRTHETVHCRYNKDVNQFVPPSGFHKTGDHINPWDNAHNEYIQLFFEFGIFGVALLILLIADVKKRFNSSSKLQISIIGFFISVLICGTGQFPMHLARLAHFVPIMLGIYYKITEKEYCHG